MNIFVAILGLAVLILVHEAGHFVVARAVGMSPRKFYIGFPPALAKVRRKGIEYGIGAIPLGGYVKIPGMHRPAPSDVDLHLARAVAEAPELGPPADRIRRALAVGDMALAATEVDRLEAAVKAANLSPATARSAERGVRELRDGLGQDAYWRQATWRKIAVIFAGPGTNLVFAVALLAAVFMIGVPVEATNRVDDVLPDSPAARVGLQPGDQILALNGVRVGSGDISETIRSSGGSPLELRVRRGERVLRLGPAAPERDGGVYRLGFVLEPRYETASLPESVWLATKQTWLVTKAIATSIGGLVTGETRDDVSSPVGIVQGSSQALEAGFRYYLQVLALISLSLALLNLLPLLPLDGGHIAFSIVEGIRRRSLGREVYERVSIVGIAIVLLLFAIGLSNDIDRLNGG